ncbi:uncharacterized protein LOC132546449 [Ylistrum balloti]|uniref:uncharacterized protein LOC132546449 n=1 Tax=Ylistrum balloti TaxID=509963 RepID=UPI002905DDB8|nr:uncharacterized protein LOC132546449 [Ylistrum balloti]
MEVYKKNSESKWHYVYKDIMRCRVPNDASDDSGFTLDDLQHFILDVLKKDQSPEDIKEIFKDLDVNGEVRVSHDVFVKEMSKLPRRLAFDSMFNMKDYNRDGFLCVDEIKDLYDLVNVKKEVFERLLDKDGDDKISKEEFMALV